MAKHSILIVDHQNTVLGLAKKVLADDGYEVHVAGSSREAIDLSRGLGPELLVINPAMPTLSGVEAARQISRDAKCKVLFLSDLAKDSDFREMLRGLRQQGCECSAIGVPFESNELLAYVRREIGSVVVRPSMGNSLRPPPPARAAAAAAPARAPLPDYQPLLEMVGPQLYERNAFRVTALGVDASLRDISRQAEKLEMMAKLGVSGIAKELFSTAPATAEEIRAALLCLKTPDKRLLHEFFWFWPTNRQSETDPALDAIKAGDVRKAEEVWNLLAVKQQELTSVSAQLDSQFGCRAQTLTPEETRSGTRGGSFHSQPRYPVPHSSTHSRIENWFTPSCRRRKPNCCLDKIIQLLVQASKPARILGSTRRSHP